MNAQRSLFAAAPEAASATPMEILKASARALGSLLNGLPSW
jgi:hypothetical protein